MNKFFWLIPAALAVLIIGGCLQIGVHDSGTVQNVSAPGSPGEDPAKKPLHEMPVDEIAAAFIRHNANLSGYSATVYETGQTVADDAEYRLFVQRPDRFRAEYIRSEIHGKGTIVVANGTVIWRYDPDTKNARPALIEDPNNTFFAWKDCPAIAARILEKFPAVMNGTKNQSGSNTVIIEAAIDDLPTQYYPTIFSRCRIWIDEGSLMLTRMDLIGAYNETVLSVAFQDICVNPPPPEGGFDFEPPPGSTISPSLSDLVAPMNISSIYQAKLRFGTAFRQPSALPAGYSFGYCLHYRDSDGRDSIVYSNGTDELVFTQALTGSGMSAVMLTTEGVPIQVGNRTGTYRSMAGKNQINWREENLSCQLTGTLPPAELVRIARSLTAPALTNFSPEEIKDPEMIAAIALRDPSAQKMVDAGGEILGVGMLIKRGTKNVPGGIFPALSIRYNGLLVDFMVDPVTHTSVGRTIQVPNNAMVRHVGDQTVIEYEGETLFTFDPAVGA